MTDTQDVTVHSLPLRAATGWERYQIGELIADLKARATFYEYTKQNHPTDSFATMDELISLANGLSGAANLDIAMLQHPFEVVRLYTVKRLKQANTVIDITSTQQLGVPE